MEFETLILTKNRCHMSGKTISAKGIVVHSTGANNPNLKRYVGPDDGILGENQYNNHWNQSDISKCVHAFIGYDKNQTVCCYQTLPWNFRPWGCGRGSKGSFNDSHIQFEICEDDKNSEVYFNQAFGKAIELCAYLCKYYEIPDDKIVSHKEASALGYASDHGDPEHWMTNFNWTMNTFRQNVLEKLQGSGNNSSDRVIIVTYSGVEGLNIRSAPRIGNNIVRVALQGEKLNIIGKKGQWFELRNGNYVTATSKYVAPL